MAGWMERTLRFLARPIAPGSRTRVGDLVLIVWFAALSSFQLLRSFVNWALGWDSIIYTDAAKALLRGDDAWGAAGGSAIFAGPPTSLLPFFPFVWLPDPIVATGGAAIAAACAIYVLRKLRLPMWWLLFPPIIVAILAGSSALLVTALLVRGGPIAEGLAIAFRPYAALPMLFLGRWRSLVVAALVVGITSPFLDWQRFLAKSAFIQAVLDDQSGGGHSAAAIPILIPVALVCLFLLGRRLAAWLVVPALWPYSQNYYSVIALPIVAEAPLVALAMTVDLPGIVVIGLVTQVVVNWIRGQRGPFWTDWTLEAWRTAAALPASAQRD